MNVMNLSKVRYSICTHQVKQCKSTETLLRENCGFPRELLCKFQREENARIDLSYDMNRSFTEDCLFVIQVTLYVYTVERKNEETLLIKRIIKNF